MNGRRNVGSTGRVWVPLIRTLASHEEGEHRIGYKDRLPKIATIQDKTTIIDSFPHLLVVIEEIKEAVDVIQFVLVNFHRKFDGEVKAVDEREGIPRISTWTEGKNVIDILSPECDMREEMVIRVENLML